MPPHIYRGTGGRITDMRATCRCYGVTRWASVVCTECAAVVEECAVSARCAVCSDGQAAGTVIATCTMYSQVQSQSLQHVSCTARYSHSHCNVYSVQPCTITVIAVCTVYSWALSRSFIAASIMYSQAQSLQQCYVQYTHSHCNMYSVQLGTVAVIATCTARYNQGCCNMCTARHSHCNMDSVRPSAVTATWTKCSQVQSLQHVQQYT